MANKYLRRLLHWCWVGFATVVITTAVLVSVARMLMPLLDNYRSQIEQVISDRVERPVTIGELRAGWGGLHPEIQALNVTIYNPDTGEKWLHFDELRASVRLWDSLINREMATGELRLVGLDADIERRADGSYWVSGVKTGENKRLLRWLLSRRRITLRDSQLSWVDERFTTIPVPLGDAQLELERQGKLRRISGVGQLPGGEERLVQFVVTMRGELDPEDPKLNFYATGYTGVGQWFDGELLAPYRPAAGDVAFSVWGRLDGGLSRLTAEFDARGLRWPGPASGEKAADDPGAKAAQQDGFALRRASGRVFWQRVPGGWDATVEDLTLRRTANTPRWPASRARIRWRFDPAAGGDLSAMASYLRLQDIHGLLDALPADLTHLPPALHALRPRGEIRELVFRARGRESLAADLYLDARVHDLGFAPWDGRPGLAGVDGRLRMNEDSGFAALSTQDLVVNMPSVFREPMHADRLQGRVFVSRDAQGWHVHSPSFTGGSKHLRGRGRFTLDVPRAERSPVLDMQLEFFNGDVAQAQRYLPAKKMPPEAVAWLDRSLAGGRLTRGSVLFHGALAAFPFEGNEGTFQATFAIEDGLLDYGEGWPRAEELAAQVRFRNRSMEAQINGAKVYGVDIERATARIDQLNRKGVFELRTQASGPAADMLRYLRHGPLREPGGAQLDEVKASGWSRVALDLRMPIDRPDDAAVEGRLTLDRAGLSFPRWELALSRMRGKVDFEYRGETLRLSSEGIDSRYQGDAARVNVNTSLKQGRLETRVELRTHQVAHKLLGKHTARLQQYVEGASDWLLSAEFPADDPTDQVRFHLESPLQGVTVNLPGHLQKPAAMRRPLLIDTVVYDGSPGRIAFTYGDALAGVLGLREGAVERAALHFGSERPALPGTRGLYVTGKLTRFSLTRWREWAEAHGFKDEGSGAGTIPMLQRLDVEVDELEAFDYVLRGVDLQMQREPRWWQAQVESRELGGDIRVPHDRSGEEPVVLKLSHLHLIRPEEEKEPRQEQPRQLADVPDPRQLPPIELTSKTFTYNRIPLGSLELSARRTDQGLRVQALNMASDRFKLEASGEWALRDGEHTSEFNIRAESPDLGRALQAFGYTPGISGGRSQVELRADWKGPPHWFEMKRLNGKLLIEIRDGELVNVEPGGGRIFGLLSFQALPRRLSLDFSDISSRGFAFDWIRGSFVIADGDAYTNDLRIASPAAGVEISGRIGLAAQDYDQTVVVIPQVSSTMPLVGGLAGGPGVGLGLWLADRVFGKQIDKLTQVRYTITGSWEAPQVNKVGKE